MPTLVTIDENGCTITTDARGRAGNDPSGLEFPWLPKPINDLADGPGDINETPSLIMLMEKVEASKQVEYEAMMKEMAEAVMAAKATPDADPSMLFFTSKADGGIGQQLRGMTNVGDAKDGAVTMLLLEEKNKEKKENDLKNGELPVSGVGCLLRLPPQFWLLLLF